MSLAYTPNEGKFILCMAKGLFISFTFNPACLNRSWNSPMALGRKIKWIQIKNNKDEIINWLNLEKTIKETIPRTKRINIGIKKFAGVKKTSISSLKTFQIMSFSEEAKVSNTIGKDDIKPNKEIKISRFILLLCCLKLSAIKMNNGVIP